MPGARESIEALLFAFVGGPLPRIIELLDQAGGRQCIERSVQLDRPEPGASIRQLLDGPGDAQPMKVAVGEGEQDEIVAGLHARYIRRYNAEIGWFPVAAAGSRLELFP